MFLLLLLSIASISKEVLSFSVPVEPCKITDSACLDKNANTLIPIFTKANEEHNIDSSDPLFLKKIVGDLSIIKYTIYNTTHTGLSDCSLSNVRFDEEITKLHCELTCPKLSMHGKYEVSGRLIALPVEGSGDYTLTTGKYNVIIDSDIVKATGEDGKLHIAFKNLKLDPKALESMHFEFKNLFNGQKDLSNAVHKFADENWKEVAELVQDPVWHAIMKNFIRNYNKYLKIVPLENFISI